MGWLVQTLTYESNLLQISELQQNNIQLSMQNMALNRGQSTVQARNNLACQAEMEQIEVEIDNLEALYEGQIVEVDTTDETIAAEQQALNDAASAHYTEDRAELISKKSEIQSKYDSLNQETEDKIYEKTNQNDLKQQQNETSITALMSENESLRDSRSKAIQDSSFKPS